MGLLTQEQLDQLRANDMEAAAAFKQGKRPPDHYPVVRLYNPTGGMEWLLTQVDADIDLAYGLGVYPEGPRTGSVSLADVSNEMPKSEIHIVRDLYWRSTHPLSVYEKAARRLGWIETDPATLDAFMKVEA